MAQVRKPSSRNPSTNCINKYKTIYLIQTEPFHLIQAEPFCHAGVTKKHTTFLAIPLEP